MAQAQGTQSYLAIQKETTYGVAPASPAMIRLPFASESLSKSVGLENNDHIYSGRNSQAPRRGTVDVAGSINFNLGFYPGELLLAVLGSVDTAAPTHTFKVGSALPSFTIEKGFTDVDQYFLFKGCKANRFSLTVSQSGFQKASIDFMGASEAVGSTPFDSSLTDLGDNPVDGFAISSIQEGGSAADFITELTLNIDNALDGDTFVLGGGGVRGSMIDGICVVSGTLKGFFEDMALYNKAINNTESSLLWTYTRGTGAGTAGNEKLTIEIPELVYSVKSPAISGPQGIYYELDWQAYYGNDADASQIIMTLLNTQTTI